MAVGRTGPSGADGVTAAVAIHLGGAKSASVMVCMSATVPLDLLPLLCYCLAAL